jgi:hypothetical protein
MSEMDWNLQVMKRAVKDAESNAETFRLLNATNVSFKVY